MPETATGHEPAAAAPPSGPFTADRGGCDEHRPAVRLSAAEIEDVVRASVTLARTAAGRAYRRYSGLGFQSHDELAQDALIGIFDAARRFDPSQGRSFSTFAMPRAYGEILDRARAASWVPRHQLEQAKAAARAVEALSVDGNVPTSDQVAAELGVSVADYEETVALAGRRVVTESALRTDPHEPGDPDPRPLANVADTAPSVEDRVLGRERTEILKAAIATLPARHAAVMSCLTFDGYRGREVAALLNVTESRVSQLRSEAVDMLRQELTAVGFTPN